MEIEEKREVLKKYSEGISVRALASMFHTSPKKVKEILFEMGVDVNDPNRTIGPKVVKPYGYWKNKAVVEEAAKTCRNKYEFGKKFVSAYKYSLKNGWLAEFSEKYFSDRPEFPSLDAKIHTVYSYEIANRKSVYVGRTSDLKRRDHAHRNPLDNSDTIYKFCKANDIEIPPPRILESGLTGYESQIKEDEWVRKYSENGWNVLNIAKTGLGVGSLGATAPKWTYESCKLAAEGCKNKEEFKHKYSRAHNISRKCGWIDEFFPVPFRAKDGSFDTLDGCKEACVGFKSIMQIRREYPFLYHKISKNKWTDEIRAFINEDKASKFDDRNRRNGIVLCSMNEKTGDVINKMTPIELEFYHSIYNENIGVNPVIDDSSTFGSRFIVRCDKEGLMFILVNVHNNGNLYNEIKNCELSKYVEYGNLHGYKVFLIYDSEYKYSKNIVVGKIKNALNVNCESKEKIDARKCDIREILKDEAYEFLEKYHIQGFVGSTVYLGAFYKDRLVAVMTFRNGGINRINNWDLTRFVGDDKCILRGVGSKMFTYFVRKYSPSNVVSFSDKRWGISNENLYTKMGFKKDTETSLSYSYFSKDEIDCPHLFHKLLFNKNYMLKKYSDQFEINDSMTESEIVKILGYDRIWDCGLIKYVWKNGEHAD